MSIEPTTFSELNSVLSDLASLARGALRENLVGVYLQGSFALGDADEHSDVDFLVIIRREPDDAQVLALQEGHRRIFDGPSEWSRHLEGSYIPETHIQQWEITGNPFWYLDNGSRVLELSHHDDTRVVRWTMHEHGVAIEGPPAKELVHPVPSGGLREEVFAKLQEWAEELLSGSWRLFSRWEQPYAVLSFCRMLHTLKTGRVESKLAGAMWAREALHPRWRDLIDAAWADRPDPWIRVHQPADPSLVALTLEFVRAIATVSYSQ